MCFLLWWGPNMVALQLFLCGQYKRSSFPVLPTLIVNLEATEYSEYRNHCNRCNVRQGKPPSHTKLNDRSTFADIVPSVLPTG